MLYVYMYMNSCRQLNVFQSVLKAKYVILKLKNLLLSIIMKIVQGVQKNDATFNQYLFLCFNRNWYAFNIYYTENQYPLRISN